MSSVVQEYGAPNGTTNGTKMSTPPLSLDEQIAQTAQEYGIERPRSHNVSFHYNSSVEKHHFGRSHPMKPWRLQLTKQLILSFGLQYAMECHETRSATRDEMVDFHNEDYLEFLELVTPDNMSQHADTMAMFGFGDDCPVFDGLFDYCSNYTGATIASARTLLQSPPGTNSSSRNPAQSDIAINWSGGLHHAHKSNASGFCYVNDIVLAILILLTKHPRVLYIDIDVHHGDGVEEAFASSDRVMTLSLHKYEKDVFFPGTGGPTDSGPKNPRNPGARHSLNVPLRDGIDDAQYEALFDTIVKEAVAVFQPTAIVLQCGADSLGGDRLGKFNLNIRGHGHCVSTCRAFGLPLLLLGGGGYTARNVARLWCHETALAAECSLPLNANIPNHVPYRRAFEGQENGNGLLYPVLDDDGKRHKNDHDAKYLNDQVSRIMEQLRYLRGAPSVQMQRMPRDIWTVRQEVEEDLREDEDEERSGPNGDEAAKRRKKAERNVGGRSEMPTR